MREAAAAPPPPAPGKPVRLLPRWPAGPPGEDEAVEEEEEEVAALPASLPAVLDLAAERPLALPPATCQAQALSAGAPEEEATPRRPSEPQEGRRPAGCPGPPRPRPGALLSRGETSTPSQPPAQRAQTSDSGGCAPFLRWTAKEFEDRLTAIETKIDNILALQVAQSLARVVKRGGPRRMQRQPLHQSMSDAAQEHSAAALQAPKSPTTTSRASAPGSQAGSVSSGGGEAGADFPSRVLFRGASRVLHGFQRSSSSTRCCLARRDGQEAEGEEGEPAAVGSAEQPRDLPHLIRRPAACKRDLSEGAPELLPGSPKGQQGGGGASPKASPSAGAGPDAVAATATRSCRMLGALSRTLSRSFASAPASAAGELGRAEDSGVRVSMGTEPSFAPEVANAAGIKNLRRRARWTAEGRHDSWLDLGMLHMMMRIQKRTLGRSQVMEKIWAFLEDPESSWAAGMYERVVPGIVLLTVGVTLVQLLDPPPLSNVAAASVEVSIEVAFAMELALRFLVSPAKMAFFRNQYNCIDLASILPLGERASIGLVIDIQRKDRSNIHLAILLGFVPVIRLLKVVRQFHKFHLLTRAFQLAFEAMPVMIFIYVSLMGTFSTILYLVEPHDNIQSIPDAMWLAYVSMATVGYGDVTPESTPGRLIVGVLVWITSLYMAIPLGIIGNAFTAVWADRHRVLLAQRTRNRLQQCGYTGQDIPQLFHLFDEDKDGVIDRVEFEIMLTEMGVGLKGNRIGELFDLADQDGSGEINEREFVKLLFPYEYNDIFKDAGEEESAACGGPGAGRGPV